LHGFVDYSKSSAHIYSLTLGNQDLGEVARGWRGDLGIHFVRRNLEERLILFHLVA
jgi:hypothetical protein